MSISNIDELLMGGSTSQNPMSPEEKTSIEEQVYEVNEEEQEYEGESDKENNDESNDESNEDYEENETNSQENSADEIDEDEYGNQKERMSKGMKERLDRKERQFQREIDQREQEINQLRAQLAQQGASQQVQQAAKDFEYDPNDEGNWQQQLASFVKQTVTSMTREQQDYQRQQQEIASQREFETKFRNGMNKFDDFREVVGNLGFDITDPMTLATRSMDNPAAFIYAAAKRNPKELKRISKIRDPYGQMMEMGKLEERMRKAKSGTKAPRPIGRVTDDATPRETTKKKELTGDDLLAKADAKRLQTVRSRHTSNR